MTDAALEVEVAQLLIQSNWLAFGIILDIDITPLRLEIANGAAAFFFACSERCMATIRGCAILAGTRFWVGCRRDMTANANSGNDLFEMPHMSNGKAVVLSLQRISELEYDRTKERDRKGEQRQPARNHLEHKGRL